MNFNSIAHHRHKTGVNRSYSTEHIRFATTVQWTSFNNEATKLKQILTSINFPMSLTDEELNKFLAIKVEGAAAENPPELIKLLYRSQMSSGNYKQEDLIFKNTIHK